MSSLVVEGFSISHAAILNGATGAEEAAGDLYGVREGSLEPDTDSYDNEGDDTILSSWSWFNFATVEVSGGYIPFELIALLTGATITSSGASPNDYYNLPLWSEKSLNQSTRPMLIRVPSKDHLGAIRKLDIVLYKIQFDPLSFEGPSYKEGLTVNYSGKCLMSSVDEKGTTLTEKSIGRLVSRPE